MVRFLLEAGADQEHKTDEMHTALMEACMVRDVWLEQRGICILSSLCEDEQSDSFWSPFGTEPNHVMFRFSCVPDGPLAEEIGGAGNTWLKNRAC